MSERCVVNMADCGTVDRIAFLWHECGWLGQGLLILCAVILTWFVVLAAMAVRSEWGIMRRQVAARRTLRRSR